MRNVIVLGAGRVGAAMARDLAADPDLRVTAADARDDALNVLGSTPEGPALRFLRMDLDDPEALDRALEGQDLAVGAVPGPMGFRTLRQVIERGVHVVDISFCEEDPIPLDEVAGSRGVVAIVDAGVAPGLSNLILGHHEARLAETTRFECLVGGIPTRPRPPWGYTAPFSPVDVVAEYTRPARLRREGRLETLPAMAELETVEIPGVGRLEAFLTDGLRTLLQTSRTPELLEKTLRWPGHADRIAVLRETGFLDDRPRWVHGHAVSPLALTTALLADAWRPEPGEAELTVMRVTVDGRDDSGPVRHAYHLLDRGDSRTGVSPMARCTGYTATALARLVLNGEYREPGLAPPETVAARHDALAPVLEALRDRGVAIQHRVSRPGPASRPTSRS
jgi:lysine 6-dehydrogenase